MEQYGDRNVLMARTIAARVAEAGGEHAAVRDQKQAAAYSKTADDAVQNSFNVFHVCILLYAFVCLILKASSGMPP